MSSYSSIHHKIKSWRGPASEHACGICGKPAKIWSCYRNKTITEDGVNGLVSYSDDIFDYLPTCRPCGGKLDSPLRDKCKNGHSDWYIQGQQRRCRTCFNQWQQNKRKSGKR